MDPFIGEIRSFPFSFAPVGWAVCEGQAISRQQFPALFSIIGITYGRGDGVNTFNLPNLMGRAPLGAGAGTGLTPRSVGQATGDVLVNLNSANFPPHTHGMNVASGQSTSSLSAATTNVLAKIPSSGKPAVTTNTYTAPGGNAALNANAVVPAGSAVSSIAHNNMQPYLPLLMCIATDGVYPVRP